MRKQKRHNFRLTSAGKRATITLRTEMIEIIYKGRLVKCSTLAEAEGILKVLAEEEEKKARREDLPMWQLALQNLVGNTVNKSPWTHNLFSQFVENLGDSQKQILTLLVRNRKMTAGEMCKALRVDGNQALAGVLSGLSKQAGALDVPARSVYVVEDERKDGEVAKTYAIALDFLQMAMQMNWPPE